MIHPVNATAHSLSAQRGTSVLDGWHRYLPLALAATALLGLIPVIYFSGLRWIEYDSFWELFTATQDRWRDFVAEGKVGANPLLFHLIMRGVTCSKLGNSPKAAQLGNCVLFVPSRYPSPFLPSISPCFI